MQLGELQREYTEFTKRNVGLVTISTDQPQDAVDMAVHVGADYPILADSDTTVTRAYGVFNLLGDGVSAPAVFVIWNDGTVRSAHVGESISGRPTAEQIIKVIDAIEADSSR